MIKKILDAFRRKKKPSKVIVDSGDPIMDLVVSEAFTTGKMIHGHVDDDGILHMTYSDLPKDNKDE